MHDHPPGTRTSTSATPATAPAPSPTSSPASPTCPGPTAPPASPTSAAAPATSPPSSPTAGPTAHITGYDNSPEMLDQAAATTRAPPRAAAASTSPTPTPPHWAPDEPYDLIVSNAALQWVPGHADAFAAWIDALAPGGTFAFQVPGNFDLAQPRPPARTRATPRSGATGSASPAAADAVHILEPADYLDRAHRPRLRGRRLGDHLPPAPAGRGPGPRLGQGHRPAARPDRPRRRPGGPRRASSPNTATLLRAGLPDGPARHRRSRSAASSPWPGRRG